MEKPEDAEAVADTSTVEDRRATPIAVAEGRNEKPEAVTPLKDAPEAIQQQATAEKAEKAKAKAKKMPKAAGVSTLVHVCSQIGMLVYYLCDCLQKT